MALPVVNAPLGARPAVSGPATLATVAVVLALPLGATITSPGVVVAAIGIACAALAGVATAAGATDDGS